MTRIDRRALFATGSAAALLAAVGVSAEAPPTRGGHLRAALSGGDRGEDWLSVPGGRFLQAARHCVFESLTEIAADGTLQPGLATDWHAREGGRHWTFDMATGVAFHDGSALSVHDIVASLDAYGLKARALGGARVEVMLYAPDPTLPFRLARGGFVVFKSAELSEGAVRTGTGLYRLRRFDAGRGFLGERVDTHRKDGQAGWFDTVELVSITDDAVRADALRQGIVDVADLTAEHDLGHNGSIALVRDGGDVLAGVSETVQMSMRPGPHPLDDMRFAERWWKRA